MQQPFFFLGCPPLGWFFCGAQGTDFLVKSHQFLTELLPTLEFRHFALGFPQSCGSGKALIHGLAFYFPAQAELGQVSRIIAPGAVASSFSTTAHTYSDGTRSKIAQGKELLEELGPF